MKHFKANFYYFDAKTVYAYVKIINTDSMPYHLNV